MAVEKIADGVVVSIAYVLKVDGQEVERADADDPIEYLHGAANIVPGLEEALNGRAVGDKFSVTVAPEDGYGPYDKTEVERIPRKDIPGVEQLKRGMMVEMEDDEGYIYEATVMEITKDSVVLDFNHTLAGKTLNFDVEVVGLREADEEEIAHGHAHSEDWDEDDDDWDDDDEDSDDDVDRRN
ncbi:MAG: peptidylprolyl isomerase [Chloroflexi bacterium]|nr:peptidylprolyl isomerase [Chloroflexota bacterium]